MSTRDEILAALMNHPTGLTYKEIAKHCKACGCDEQIVGRLLTSLRSEGVVHVDGSRDGMNIYLVGAGAAEEVRESPITLNTPPSSNKEHVMPQRLTVVERAIEALKKHGPCTLEQLAKHIGSTRDSLYTISGALKARGVVKTYDVKGKPSVYSFGKKTTPERGTGRQLRAAAGNGSGDAEVPAAGPAILKAIESLKAERAVRAAEIEKLDRAIEAIEALA